jgi:hypothetical protein
MLDGISLAPNDGRFDLFEWASTLWLIPRIGKRRRWMAADAHEDDCPVPLDFHHAHIHDPIEPIWPFVEFVHRLVTGQLARMRSEAVELDFNVSRNGNAEPTFRRFCGRFKRPAQKHTEF